MPEGARLIIQVARGGAVERHLRDDPSPSSAGGSRRGVVLCVMGDA
jgi:hypothetical protein